MKQHKAAICYFKQTPANDNKTLPDLRWTFFFFLNAMSILRFVASKQKKSVTHSAILQFLRRPPCAHPASVLLFAFSVLSLKISIFFLQPDDSPQEDAARVHPVSQEPRQVRGPRTTPAAHTCRNMPTVFAEVWLTHRLHGVFTQKTTPAPTSSHRGVKYKYGVMGRLEPCPCARVPCQRYYSRCECKF